MADRHSVGLQTWCLKELRLGPCVVILSFCLISYSYKKGRGQKNSYAEAHFGKSLERRSARLMCRQLITLKVKQSQKIYGFLTK